MIKRDSINTLEYGVVKVRYNKLYTMNYINTVELCTGEMFNIYTNWNGELIAILNEELTKDNTL